MLTFHFSFYIHYIYIYIHNYYIYNTYYLTVTVSGFRNIALNKSTSFHEAYVYWGQIGHNCTSLVAQMVKNLTAMQETQV